MRYALVLLAITATAAEMPSGYVRGPMVGWDGSVTLGTLRVRSAGEVLTCGFDAKSYLEFQKQRVTMDKLREGDPLEVLAYRRPGETACYVLSLMVVPPPVATRPTKRIDVTPSKQVRPTVVRHGTENIAGVVARVSSGSLTLHTRDGDRAFLLRPDTRYFGNGLRMEAGDVTANSRVSVEAGRNLEGQWEAFQLTWGELSGTR